jgi:sugar transferase (PEP-CTERM/EpsH1 system associated)
VRVLFLSHRIPYPPDKGDKIRSYHLLVRLARRHEVDLVTHVDDPTDLRHQQLLADFCRSVSVFPLAPLRGRLRAGLALLTGGPLSVAWMTRPAAARRVAALLAERRHDLIVGFSSQVAAYLPPCGGPPVVFDLVDVDSEKWAQYATCATFPARLLYATEARRMRRFERRLAGRAASLVLTTQRERDLFLERVGPAEIEVVTNGVIVPPEVPPAAARESGLMVFVGQMDYGANVNAAVFGAREILPRIRERLPQARFRIVGRNPAPEVRALGDLPGVEVTGLVPDLGVHLGRASLALVPLRVARGIQNKVIEALAWGLPVVTTPPVAGSLHASASGFLRVGRDAGELAREAVELLSEPESRRRACEAGRAWVSEHHDWEAVGRRWDAILEGATRSPVAEEVRSG